MGSLSLYPPAKCRAGSCRIGIYRLIRRCHTRTLPCMETCSDGRMDRKYGKEEKYLRLGACKQQSSGRNWVTHSRLLSSTREQLNPPPQVLDASGTYSDSISQVRLYETRLWSPFCRTPRFSPRDAMRGAGNKLVHTYMAHGKLHSFLPTMKVPAGGPPRDNLECTLP